MSAGGYDLRPRQLRALIVLLILLPLLPSAVIVRFFVDAARYELTMLADSWKGFYASYAKALSAYMYNQAVREFAGFVDRAGGADGSSARDISARADVDSVVVFSTGTATAGGEVWQSGRRVTGVDPPAAVGMIGTLRSYGSGQPLWRRLPGTGLLGRVIEGDGWWLVVLRDREDLKSALEKFIGGISGPDIRWQLIDDASTLVFPAKGFTGLASVQSLDGIIDDWSLHVAPSDDAVPGDAGFAEQIRLYQQVSVLVLGAVLVVGLLAGWAITRQIRLQDIKNSALAAVAHELKTPIASSRLLIETIESSLADSSSAKWHDYIHLLAKDNARLAQVVSDFLLFSRIEQKRYQPQRTPIELGTVVDEALDMARATLEESGVAWNVRREDGDILVAGDRGMLARAVVNLIGNAVKHAPRGTEVTLTIRKSGTHHAELLVRDQGDGIPPAELRRIFRPFYQVDGSLSRHHEGTGLGLSIVRRVVAAHKGSIWAESDGKSGSTFIIRLPITRR